MADRPGGRSVSRFLHQYGRALAGAGRPRDAAVVYMQVAVLYEGKSPRSAVEDLMSRSLKRETGEISSP